MSIKRIVVADASEGDNGTLRTAGGGGSGASPKMRFSVEDSNVESPRSAGGGASGAPRTMDECEGFTKRIDVEDKGGGGNGTLRTAGGGGSGAPPTMRFSFNDSNRAYLISDGVGDSGAPRTMEKWGGYNEGGNGATPPRRATVINSYAKQSRPGRFRKGGSETGNGAARKGGNSSGHIGKRKVSGAKFNSKKNGPRKMGRASLMHAFEISGIGADVGREESEEGSNYVFGEAHSGEGCGNNIPRSN